MRALCLGVVLTLGLTQLALAEPINWGDLDKAFGRKGMTQGDMYKVTFPRSDLDVKMGTVQVKPDLALTSWLAFKPHGNDYMVMGDLVLAPAEVKSVEEAIMANGLEISALHNHLIGSNPSVMYMHVDGYGSLQKLVTDIKSTLKQTKTPMEKPAPAKSQAYDWSKVQTILGTKGKDKGQVIQFSFPRKDKITDRGMEMPAFMGNATSVNFQALGKQAAATGDFVLIADEVNPVVQALVSHGIEVTAIHNHMLHDEPRIFFLHFWGVDSPEKLAQGIKAALQKTQVPDSLCHTADCLPNK